MSSDTGPSQGTLTGTTVGRFTIGLRLGSGGMGEVYRAEDTQLKRTVAIKRLTSQSQGDYRKRSELLREAQRASALNHSRIAGVYDVFCEGDEFFLVMEYIDGTTLRERVESSIGITEFFGIALQCVEALAVAHEKGILHGDLKPANIMLTRVGDVKVCDFGLARRVSESDQALADTVSTVRAGIVGTPAYMAPEIIREEPPDLRADIFSLGVVFYEMLAGKNPFARDSLIRTIDLVRTHSPESLDRVNPEVPPKLARIVQRMMEKDLQKRYATISEVREDLAATYAEFGVRRERVPRFQRKWLLAAAGGFLALVAVVIFGLDRWRMNTPQEPLLPASINLAVLPFSVTGGTNTDTKFFSQGLAETLTRQLSRLTANRTFQVATTTELRARNVKTPEEARDHLGANVVLSGTLQYLPGGLQITSVLTDAKSGRVLRQATVSGNVSNFLDAEKRVAEASIGMLGFTLSADERAALDRNQTTQPGAYDFYLQGRGYLLNFDRIENLDSAVSTFRKSLEIDPRYALAYAGLGETYWRKHEITSAAVWVEPARAACEGALGINSELAEAHACLGMVLNGTGEYENAAAQYDMAITREPTNDLFYTGLATAYEKLGKPDDAEQTYRRAIELRPHYWAAYDRLGAYYYRLSRYGDAITMFRQVVALAPDSMRGYSSLGAAYFMKDEMDNAIAAFEKSLAIKPNWTAANNLGTLYFFEADYRRAADAFRKAVALDENYQSWGNLASALQWTGEADQSRTAYRRARELAEERLRVNPKNVSIHMALANHNAALGDMDTARASFDQVLKSAPTDSHTLFQIAEFYEFRLKQRENALMWLARAIEHGQTWREIDHAADLGELRKDPRFLKLRGEKQSR